LRDSGNAGAASGSGAVPFFCRFAAKKSFLTLRILEKTAYQHYILSIHRLFFAGE